MVRVFRMKEKGLACERGKALPKTYLWIEDREGKASYVFWKTMMRELFPEVTVEGKKNNSELVKAVSQIKESDDIYFILFDNSFDNVQAYREQKRLRHYTENKGNIFLVEMICFEFVLLEFNRLIDWIYAPGDEFLISRAGLIQARSCLIEALNSGNEEYKKIREMIEYDPNIKNHNIEQIAADLLFALTRNTGFETSKGKIGNCWVTSCCEWTEREENDICGLDEGRMSCLEKMRYIWKETSLSEKFSKCGLEVSG